MEREILFRAKRKDNGEWIESLALLQLGKRLYMFQTAWGEITYDLQHNITAILGEKPFFVEVVPETRGQYTGLTDKNGRKIFEGDIVKDDVDDTGIVYWDEYYCALMISYIDKNSIYYFHNNDFNEVEVISNIHDFSELMKGE